MTQAPAIAEQPKSKAWHNRSAEEVLTQFNSSATGLSAQEAAKRLAANGPNELKESKDGNPETSSMPLADCFLLLAVGAIPLLVLELVKVVRHARRQRKTEP